MPSKNDPRLEAVINSIPEKYRIELVKDAVDSLNGYSPASLDEGMGRFLTNDQVREYIATEGHHPKTLPDIITAGNRCLVREMDRSGYYKLVFEGGRWFCGCRVPGCIHKMALLEKGIKGEA